jgi:hypothetical protein
LTARFIAFRSHWHYQAEFCTPSEGHEKGGVEGGVGYFRRNHWVPVPVAVDLAALNRKLHEDCRARTLVTGTQMGTYTVNCDGTGVITRVLTAGTVQTTQEDDFVITGAVEKDGELIATSIQDAQRTPSAIVPGGIFLRRVWTRLP